MVLATARIVFGTTSDGIVFGVAGKGRGNVCCSLRQKIVFGTIKNWVQCDACKDRDYCLLLAKTENSV